MTDCAPDPKSRQGCMPSPPLRGRLGPLLLLALLLVGYGFVLPRTSTPSSSTSASSAGRPRAWTVRTAAAQEGGEHWRELVARVRRQWGSGLSGLCRDSMLCSDSRPNLTHVQLSGTAKNDKMTTADNDGKKTPGPRVLLGSGAFHLEANRTRLLSAAMREHFGDTAEVPRLLFIPYAAADGDYDAYVKRTIELVRPYFFLAWSRRLDFSPFDPTLRNIRAWTAGTSSTPSTCTPTRSRPSARPRASTSVRLAVPAQGTIRANRQQAALTRPSTHQPHRRRQRLPAPPAAPRAQAPGPDPRPRAPGALHPLPRRQCRRRGGLPVHSHEQRHARR